MTADHTLDPRFIAAVQLIQRTGAQSFRIGYSDDDDGPPVVWYACVTYKRPPGTPRWTPGEAAASLDPVKAVLRLCEQVIDGGTCTHCGRQTIFDADVTDTVFDDALNELGCVYGWDPELATFRRACEGDRP